MNALRYSYRDRSKKRLEETAMLDEKEQPADGVTAGKGKKTFVALRVISLISRWHGRDGGM